MEENVVSTYNQETYKQCGACLTKCPFVWSLKNFLEVKLDSFVKNPNIELLKISPEY